MTGLNEYRARRLLLGLVCLVTSGCATYHPPSEYPEKFVTRAEHQADGGINVSAVLLDKNEARQVFSTDLIKEEIQPIWIKIDNREDQEYLLMLLSLDPNYFSPSEAAWKSRGLGERGTEDKMEHFVNLHIPVILPPMSTSSGFVYAGFDPGAKAFSINLLGEQREYNFNFLLAVPGFNADFMSIDPESHYSNTVIRSLTHNQLRHYLETLPCCVLGGDRETDGDPLNLVIVGTGAQVLTTLINRGWDLTETLTSGSVVRTMTSSIFGRRYRTSPVSPLYVFGRSQDVALQRARKSVDERNHMRLWLAPVSLEGSPVWIGQISRDIGVKLSRKTVVTHKIDPDVDEARLYVLLDLIASSHTKSVGYVQGVGHSTPSGPRYNYTLDPYFTDGLRAVMILDGLTRGFDEIDWLDWEYLPTEFE